VGVPKKAMSGRGEVKWRIGFRMIWSGCGGRNVVVWKATQAWLAGLRLDAAWKRIFSSLPEGVDEILRKSRW
jgi:hypothetical protein